MFQQSIKTPLSKQESHDSLPFYWKQTTMAEISSISGGGTPSTSIAEYWDGDIPWLTPSEVTRCKNIFISCTERSITGAGLAASASKLLPVGTVMMTSRATIGEAVINTVPMATNQGFINILCNENQLDNVFLVYWIKHHKQALEARGYGATFKELSKSNFKSMPIFLPPLPEQRAIAHVLQTVQNAIQARRNELALERERKAALMQHLFTHGTRGEATKQTEIGEMPESWEVISLQALCKNNLGIIQTGPFGSQLHANDYIDDGVPVVNPTHLGINTIIEDHLPKISQENAVKLSRHSLVEGDILISRRGDFSRYSYITSKQAGWLCGTGCLLIRLNNPAIDNRFLSISIGSEIVQQYLAQNATGLIMPNLNTKILERLIIALPPIHEQKVIAQAIDTCDSKITALEKELALQEELFRALLEELMSGRLSALPLVETEGGAREALS